jgi:putative FmdB family regulatory protein
MPTYEYECPECEEVVEIIHGVNQKPPRKCPACGESTRLRKRLAAPAFQFKGSGWYVTDYARKKEKKEKEKARKESSAGDSSDSSKSEKSESSKKPEKKADKASD